MSQTARPARASAPPLPSVTPNSARTGSQTPPPSTPVTSLSQQQSGSFRNSDHVSTPVRQTAAAGSSEFAPDLLSSSRGIDSGVFQIRPPNANAPGGRKRRGLTVGAAAAPMHLSPNNNNTGAAAGLAVRSSTNSFYVNSNNTSFSKRPGSPTTTSRNASAAGRSVRGKLDNVAGAILFASRPLTREEDPSIPLYYTAPVKEIRIQNTPTLSCTATQTEFVPLRATGQNHREGGWPASIDGLMQSNESSFEEESGKYLKMALREDKYGVQLEQCVKKIMAGLRCNAAIEIYNMHFGEDEDNSDRDVEDDRLQAAKIRKQRGGSDGSNADKQQHQQQQSQGASASDPTQEAAQRIAESFISLPRYLSQVTCGLFDVPVPFADCVVTSVAWCPGITQISAVAFEPPSGFVQQVGEKVFAPLALVVDIDAAERELLQQQQQSGGAVAAGNNSSSSSSSSSHTVLCAPVEAGTVTSITFGLKNGNSYVIGGTSTGGVVMWDFRDKNATSLARLKADAVKAKQAEQRAAEQQQQSQQRNSGSTSEASHPQSYPAQHHQQHHHSLSQQVSSTTTSAAQQQQHEFGSLVFKMSSTGDRFKYALQRISTTTPGAAASMMMGERSMTLGSASFLASSFAGGGGGHHHHHQAILSAAEEHAAMVDRTSDPWISPCGSAVPPQVAAHRSSVVNVRAIPGRVPHEEFVSVGSDGCLLQWDARYLASGPVGTFPLSSVMPEHRMLYGNSSSPTSFRRQSRAQQQPHRHHPHHRRDESPSSSYRHEQTATFTQEQLLTGNNAATGIVVPGVPLLEIVTPGRDSELGDGDHHGDGDEEEEEEWLDDDEVAIAVEREVFPCCVEFEPSVGGATRVVVADSEGSVRVVSRLQAPPSVLQSPTAATAPPPPLAHTNNNNNSPGGATTVEEQSSTSRSGTPQTGNIAGQQQLQQQQQIQKPLLQQQAAGSIELTSTLEGVQYGPLRGIVRNPHVPKFCAVHGSVESASGFCIVAEEARVLLRIGHGGVSSLDGSHQQNQQSSQQQQSASSSSSGARGSNTSNSHSSSSTTTAGTTGITTLTWHPLRPALLMAGTSSGQVVAWDLCRSLTEPVWTMDVFPKNASVVNISVHCQGDVAFVSATIEVASSAASVAASAQQNNPPSSTVVASGGGAWAAMQAQQQQQLAAQRRQLQQLETLANMSFAAGMNASINLEPAFLTSPGGSHEDILPLPGSSSGAVTPSAILESRGNTAVPDNINSYHNSRGESPGQQSSAASPTVASLRNTVNSLHNINNQSHMHHQHQQQQQHAIHTASSSVVRKGLVAVVRFPSMEQMIAESLPISVGGGSAAAAGGGGGSYSPQITSRRRADLQAERAVLVSILDHNLHVAKSRLQQQQQQASAASTAAAATSSMFGSRNNSPDQPVPGGGGSQQRNRKVASFLMLDDPRNQQPLQKRQDDDDDDDDGPREDEPASIVVASADLARMGAQTSSIVRGAAAIADDFLDLINAGDDPMSKPEEIDEL